MITVEVEDNPKYAIRGLTARQYAMIVAALNVSTVQSDDENYNRDESLLWQVLRDNGRDYGISDRDMTVE